jgi:hypothetical protein
MGRLSRNQRYDNGAVPLALTLKVIFDPGVKTWEMGWVMMAGAKATPTFATALVIAPALLETRTR